MSTINSKLQAKILQFEMKRLLPSIFFNVFFKLSYLYACRLDVNIFLICYKHHFYYYDFFCHSWFDDIMTNFSEQTRQSAGFFCIILTGNTVFIERHSVY